MGKILIIKDAAEKALAAELVRTDSLARGAWKFVAGITVVLGFQLREIKAMVESPSPWVKILCCCSLVVLSTSLLLAFCALQRKGDGQYPRGNRLWENLKPDSVSDEAAEEALVQMLLQTREQNARLNDLRNRFLCWCGWLFLTGLLLVAGSQTLEAFEDWT
jgi:hypothetical protein